MSKCQQDNTVYFIYAITNDVNDKVYVGASKDPKLRFYQHRRDSKLLTEGEQNIFHLSMHEIGVEHFSLQILETVKGQQSRDSEEKRYIKLLNSIWPNGYNLQSGGRNGTIQRFTDPSSHYTNVCEALKKSEVSNSISEGQRESWNFIRKQKWSTTLHDLWRDNNYRKKHHCTPLQPILQLDPLSHKVIQEFSDCYEVKEYLLSNKLSKSSEVGVAIQKICSKHDLDKHYGYCWKFKHEYI